MNRTEQQHDGAIDAISAIAKHWHIAIDKSQLVHRVGVYNRPYDIKDTLSAIKLMGWHASDIKHIPTQEKMAVLPAIVRISDEKITQSDSPQYAAILSQDAQNYQLALPHHDAKEFVTVAKAQLHNSADIEWIYIKKDVARAPAKAFDLSWFLPLIKKHKRTVTRVLLISACIQLIALVSPLFFQTLIDKVLVNRSLSSLETLAIAMLGLAVLEPVMSLLRSYLFTHFTSAINSELSGRVYRHLLRLPLTFFRKRKSGEIIAKLRELDQIRDFLTGSSLTLVIDLLFVVVFLAVMFFYSPALTAIVILSLIVYLIVWFILSPMIRKRVSQEFEELSDNTGFLTEAISAIETIKSNGIEHRFNEQWKNRLSRYVKASFAGKKVSINASQIIGFIQKITSAIVLFYGVKLVLDGALSMGQLIAFNMFSGHVTLPILRLAGTWQEFQHTLISLERVGEIINHDVEKQSDAGRAGLGEIDGAITFNQVNFRYQDAAHDVLHQFSLEVNPGEVIGITGHSGSGKSTVTKLIQRLYVPSQGQVMIDGMDLALIDPDLLRQKIGVVLQENVLFNGSILDNLRYNAPSASNEQIDAALTLAGASEFVASLPQGLETGVGERGSNLSGGQRQRIAIARALINNPKLLIFDEATSALDYESEAIVLSNMAQITQGRSAVLIAHRLNALSQCDRIIVLDKGNIVEEGNHQQLLAQNGHYLKLWRLQQAQ